MSETDAQHAPTPPARRTQAISRRNRWMGWIWAVPLAALGVVAWLLVRGFAERGVDVTVTFDVAAGMKADDTKVSFRGLEVGEVKSVKLTPDRQHILVHLDLDDSVKPDLTAGAGFYLQGASLSFSNPGSLKALVAGPSILMVTGPGAPARRFAGIVGDPPEPLAASLPYVAHFQGDVGKLRAGTPVTLQGFTVGRVDKVSLMTDAGTGEIQTSVLLVLDPTRFHISRFPASKAAWPAALQTVLMSLVGHGLRAALVQSPMLIGSEQVEFIMSPDAPTAELKLTGGVPEIPAQKSGLDSLVAQLGQVPVKQIGENVRATTEHLEQLTASPQLKDSMTHLDHALAQLDRTLRTAGPQVAPTLASAHATIEQLRHTADSIDATAQAARKLLGSSAVSPNGNLQQALQELTGTARAVRNLANYMDQHPEALLRGRVSRQYEEDSR